MLGIQDHPAALILSRQNLPTFDRDVMEYAEAMSQTPPQVTDELVARLLEQLGPAALLELTAVVGFANLTARSNVALGIESQGFSRACPIPLARPSASQARSA